MSKLSTSKHCYTFIQRGQNRAHVYLHPKPPKDHQAEVVYRDALEMAIVIKSQGISEIMVGFDVTCRELAEYLYHYFTGLGFIIVK